MGALRGGVCYSTNSEAVDAHFLSTPPALSNSGTTSYLSWFEKVGSVWQIKRQSISSTGVVTNLSSATATDPTFPACTETQNFTDGMTVGWGIATVMVMAWAFAQVRKAAR